MRWRLASSLRRVLARAQREPTGGISAAVPLRREAIVTWREALLGLSERLEGPGSMSPSAIARVQLLLRDGTGPLFSATAERSLGEAIWSIADGWRDSCPGHEWWSPVAAPLDPERVAWTCACCGATALGTGAQARPA
jgi:hypothetical protein